MPRPGALAVLSSFDDGHVLLQSHATVAASGAKASWSMRGAWLMQEASNVCDPIQDPNCSMESMKVLALLLSLSATIVLVICAFSFFREDREEQITPLCPQLVVKDTELKFSLPALPIFTQAEGANNMDVMDNKDPANCVCKISMDWPDPFRGSPHGVAATVRIHKSDMTLATIVARNVAVVGQGLALCRTGCEIFGFVEPEGNKYLVRHRTGVHLLTLIGSFGPDLNQDPSNQQDIWDIEGVNPVGTKVCSMKKVGNECVGKVSQHVDAGLVICAIMATYVHRRLSQPWSATTGRIAVPMVTSPRTISPRLMDKEAEDVEKGEAPGSAAAPTAASLDAAANQMTINQIASMRSPSQSTRTIPADPEAAALPSASGTGTPPAAG